MGSKDFVKKSETIAQRETGLKYFAEEFIGLQQIKTGLITKAVAGGVSKSATSQLVFSRTDAKLEEAILYVQHADSTMQYFDRLAEQTVASAAPAEGGVIQLPEAPKS